MGQKKAFKHFQSWLIMTGKLPGPFEVEDLTVEDSYGNKVVFPKLTAVTLLLSGLAILKTCLDLNLVRVQLQVNKFVIP